MNNLVEELNLTVVSEPTISKNSLDQVSENTENTKEENTIESKETKVDKSEFSQDKESIINNENNHTEAVNNNEPIKESFSDDEQVLNYLKSKGIELESLESIKSTQEDKDIQLLKKFKEVSKNSTVDDFLNAKEIANKEWEKVDKAELVAKYLHEVDELENSDLTRKLKKLSPTLIMNEDDFYNSDNVGSYEDYVEKIEDDNLDKRIEFNSLYKKSLSHFNTESTKYKGLFEPSNNQKADTLDEYFYDLSKTVDAVEDININNTKITYTKEDKEQMLKVAQNINELPAKYFNQDGTSKDSKSLLQDMAWVNPSFREKKIKDIWQVGFNAGKENVIKNKANITLDSNNQTPTTSTSINLEDIIKRSLRGY